MNTSETQSTADPVGRASGSGTEYTTSREIPGLEGLLTDEERAERDAGRAFVRERIKLSNAPEATETAREARTILVGNGVILDYVPLHRASSL